jgi:hypothetical protein
MSKLLIAGAMALLGCTAMPTEVPLQSEFTLAIGQSVRLSGTSSTVTFESVPQDSRCPANAQCVWAGNAEVRLRITTSGVGAATSVNTGVEPRSVSAGEVRVDLLGLTPHPIAGGPAVDPKSYRVRLLAGRT